MQRTLKRPSIPEKKNLPEKLRQHELSVCKANYFSWYAGDKESYRVLCKGVLGESINVLSKALSSDRGILMLVKLFCHD